MSWRNRIVGEGTERPGDLLANPRNWRIHPREQQEALSSVLNGVGLVQRVVVNERTGFVVDGHLRVAMAMREGIEEIPVVKVDLSEEEEAVVLSTLDPLAEMSGTDQRKLNELVAEASAAPAVLYDAKLEDFVSSLATAETEGMVTGTEQEQWNPQERYEKQYLSTGVRQIQLIMDTEEYEWTLSVLKRILEEEQVESNTEAVVLLLSRWVSSRDETGVMS